MKLIAVRPSFDLPVSVREAGIEYEFTPTCELPDKTADDLVRTYPQKFFHVKSESELDAKAYTWKDSFKNMKYSEIFSRLNEKNQADIYRKAKDLLKGQEEAKSKEAAAVRAKEKAELDAAGRKAVSERKQEEAKSKEATAKAEAAKS